MTGTPWRRWYKTAQWQRLRQQTFLRDLYTCQMQGCGRIETDTAKLICDHVKPHRGDEQKFWAGPFQTLCRHCHDQKKQKAEQQTLHQRGVWY